jgi:hypothetical protein
LLAWVARHEARHQETYSVWWPNGYDAQSDSDSPSGDGIPDSVEPTLPQGATYGGPFDPSDWDSDGDQLNDNEDYVVHTQTPWSPGSANAEDWAHPGHQY